MRSAQLPLSNAHREREEKSIELAKQSFDPAFCSTSHSTSAKFGNCKLHSSACFVQRRRDVEKAVESNTVGANTAQQCRAVSRSFGRVANVCQNLNRAIVASVALTLGSSLLSSPAA